MKHERSPSAAATRGRRAVAAALCLATAACGLGGIGGDLPPADAAQVLDTTAVDAESADSATTDAFADADTAEPGTDAADAVSVADVDTWVPDAAADVTPDSGCTSASQCDDGKACTTDSCVPATGCSHTPWSADACKDGDACTVDLCDDATGCVHIAQAATACDDGDACTSDGCASASGCTHGAVSCDDANKCTQDVCDAKIGCSHILLAANFCDDGSACTTDACDAALGCTHASIDCSDANACTIDNCAVATGCVHAPLDPTGCSDNNACTQDFCIPPGGCVSTPFAATACDDNNACTQDACASATGCTHLALDGTPCDDGDACTSADTCAGASCGGQITRWLQAFPVPTGTGQWVGVAPRKDGSRVLIGWQQTASNPAKFQLITQRISRVGQAIGAVQPDATLDNLVIDDVATHGTDVLVHGHTTDNLLPWQPWYGLLDDNDQLAQSGVYEPYNSFWNSGVPRAAFGTTIVPSDGTAPFTRWYTAVDSLNTGAIAKHQFYTIDPGSKPMFHSLGDGNETCAAVLIQDGVLLGTCEGTTTTDYFRATFNAAGKVTGLVRTLPSSPSPITGIAASVRPDGHAWYIGRQAPGFSPVLVSTDVGSAVAQFSTLNIGSSSLVFGALPQPDGSAWLLGTTGGMAAVWRVDTNFAVVATRTYGPGAWLHGTVDADGLWLAGAAGALTLPWPSTSPGGIAARTDVWGSATCNPTDACVNLASCDDGNPCTDDWCSGGACGHVEATGCEDGSACTSGDLCFNGVCKSGAVGSCDDADSCTLDACGAQGCSHTAVANFSACDDGNFCTKTDHCYGGACVHGNVDFPGVNCENGGTCLADGRCVQAWATSIVAGNDHTCAITASSHVYCWGDNSNHQLGNGDVDASWVPLRAMVNSAVAGPTAIRMGAGNGFNVAWVDTSLGAVGWGRSDQFQADVDLGGKLLTTAPVAVASGLNNFASIGLGDNHGCALAANGTMQCWGQSNFGQVAGASAVGQSAVPIAGMTGILAIGVGGNDSCAIQSDGSVKCWGEWANAWHTGVVGDGGSASPLEVLGVSGASAIAVGKRHACATIPSLPMRCWGHNDLGQFGNGTPGTPAFAGGTAGTWDKPTQLAAGDDFTCELLNGSVNCWGDGSAGQMGNGTTAGNASPLVVPGMEQGFVQITARGQHACARRFDGAVFCWGTGGIPGMVASSVPVAVPDSLP